MEILKHFLHVFFQTKEMNKIIKTVVIIHE